MPHTPPVNPPPRRARLLAGTGVVLATMMFGGAFVAGRHGALAGLKPADLVTLRYAVTGACFAPWMVRSLRRDGWARPAGIGWGRAVWLTLFGAVGNAVVVQIGLALSPANHGAVLSPALTVLSGVGLSALVLGELPSAGAWVGIPVALGGLALIGAESFRATGTATWIGDAVLAASGVSWTVFTVLVRRWRVAPVPAAAVISVLSASVWIPGYAVATGFRPLLAAPLAEVAGQALFLGLLHGALAVILWARGIGVLGAARALLFPALVPVWGTLLAALVLGESLSALQWLGVAVVSAGMLATAWRSGTRGLRPATPPPAP
jgi:drug/metabolite transporter (DMT)-like permease